MAIKYANRFAQARPAGYDGLFDWDFLRGCFPRGIMPMDFDGVVELGKQFLVFETKQSGKEPDKGQRLCFKALLEIPNFTIFMLYGKTPETITRLIICHGKERRIINSATKDDVIREATEWAERIEPDWQKKISMPKVAPESPNSSKRETTIFIRNKGKESLRCDRCGSDDVGVEVGIDGKPKWSVCRECARVF